MLRANAENDRIVIVTAIHFWILADQIFFMMICFICRIDRIIKAKPPKMYKTDVQFVKDLRSPWSNEQESIRPENPGTRNSPSVSMVYDSSSIMSAFPLPWSILNLSAALKKRKTRVVAMAESVNDTSSKHQKYHVVRGASSEWESRGGSTTQLWSR